MNDDLAEENEREEKKEERQLRATRHSRRRLSNDALTSIEDLQCNTMSHCKNRQRQTNVGVGEVVALVRLAEADLKSVLLHQGILLGGLGGKFHSLLPHDEASER